MGEHRVRRRQEHRSGRERKTSHRRQGIYGQPEEEGSEDDPEEVGVALDALAGVEDHPFPGEERVLIQMNEPLRQDNLVLFQSSYGSTRRGEEYSVFSVVRNVSDKWPEYSMWVITVGMVLAFGRKLIGFVRNQAKRRPAAGGAA